MGGAGAAEFAGIDLRRHQTPPAYGTLPKHNATRNLAQRGSVRDPYAEQMPTIDAYDILDKKEAWADNAMTLYEEAKARQWNSTSDIPWSELEPVCPPPHPGRAR